jgi:hypothetical protein
MPLNSQQLADLVNRAKLRPPPIVSPPQPPPASLPRLERPRQVTPASQAAAATRPPPSTPKTLRPKVAAAAPTTPPTPSPAPQSEHTAEAADFPVGWELKKESWHFHRRFYAIFRRPMRHGEYSYLLRQIPNRAERLDEDCWRVTLPDSQRTLAVRATRRRLLTILPKDWQPPARVEQAAAERSRV